MSIDSKKKDFPMEQITHNDKLAAEILETLDIYREMFVASDLHDILARDKGVLCKEDEIIVICNNLRELELAKAMVNTKTRRFGGWAISTKGIEVQLNGGWKKEAARRMEENQKEIERLETQDRLTSEQLGNIKRSKLLSIIAIFISGITLLWKILEYVFN